MAKVDRSVKKLIEKVAARDVHAHEAHDHRGEKPTKLKNGGRTRTTKR